MQMIRTTVSLPEDLYSDLRLIALEERKSLNSLILEKLNRKPVKQAKSLDNEIEETLAFFRMVAKMGKKIDAAKAVREERDRDNA
ncbi:MAG: hypothetical protein ABIJ85_01810 [bacterium]